MVQAFATPPVCPVVGPWVGGGEGVVLAKAVKIVTFGIHYSQKTPYTGAKHERERSGESEVTSESTGCFLLGGQSSG